MDLPMPPAGSSDCVSMTRVGQEFGWSSVKAARVFKELGWRDRLGNATPLARARQLAVPCPVGINPDYHRWHLHRTAHALQEAGFSRLDDLSVALHVLRVFCGQAQDHVLSRTDRKSQREQQERRFAYQSQMARDMLDRLDRQQQAAAIVHIDCWMQKKEWAGFIVDTAFKHLGLSPQDVQAHLLSEATPVNLAAATLPNRRL